MENRNRKIENSTYAIIWLVVLSFSVLDMVRSRAVVDMPVDISQIAVHLCRRFIPVITLFLVNNFVLIPRLLSSGHTRSYFFVVALLLIAVWTWQYFDFMTHNFVGRDFRQPPHEHGGGVHPRPLLPLPLFLDFTYGLLVVGVNLAGALLFQHLDDCLERERLLKANAESRLASLKAQINPHFYMNMLNNIHGLIEIDPERAQEMVIEMSHLMRYMIYETSREIMPLASEIKFIENYLNIMRLRYPADKVSITSVFPDEASVAGVDVPPLLFLVFIENAFKHGISYRQKSYVAVSIEVFDNRVHFTCLNSRCPEGSSSSRPPGIGLQNVRKRLALIYGPKALVDITETASSYSVNLSIPAHDSTTANTHN